MVDKRRGPVEPLLERKLRDAFYAEVSTGRMTVGEAVASMRRLSRLTQPEFATHRGISVQALRQIETDTGNPTLETLNKIASIFGMQVGFVPKVAQPPQGHAKSLRSADSELGRRSQGVAG